MKILFTSFQSFEEEYYKEKQWQKEHSCHFISDPIKKNNLELALGYEAIIAFVNDKFDASNLETLAKGGLKYIGLRCAGYNNVDLKAAEKLQIKVSRVSSYSPHSISEYALGLLISLNRKIHLAYNRTRERNFSLNHLTGVNIYQKNILVLGTGKIGKPFCRSLKGLGANVLAVDPQEDEELKNEGIRYYDLKEACKIADSICLHAPLNKNTKHIINKEILDLLKPNCTIVNTSRGALIDTKALITSLKKRSIAGVALDVYEEEEELFFKDHSYEILDDEQIYRLTSFPNVLISSHQAFLTEESLGAISETCWTNLKLFQSGDKGSNFL